MKNNSELRRKLISIYLILLLLLLIILINSFQIDNIKNSQERSEYVNSDIIGPLREPGNPTRSSDDFEKYSWHHTIIDTHNSISGDISLALDSDDNPHVLYFSKNHCYYAYSDGTNWTTESIAIGSYDYQDCCLVLDENNYPHVCFNSEYTNLTYGYFNGSSWFFEVINQNFSSYLDLAMDSNGHPHIVYRGTNSSLIYDHCNGSTWVKKIFNIVQDCYGPSIKLDSNNNPHITCSNRGLPYELKYFHFDGDGWTNITVPEVLSYTRTVLELDSEDKPHVFCLIQEPGSTLHYVHYYRDRWVDTAIGRVRSIVFSFQLGSNGLPYYVNRGWDDSIRFGKYNGISWFDEGIVDKGYFSSKSYFKLDSKDNPHLIYTVGDGENVFLKYTTKFDDIVPPIADAGEDITIGQYGTEIFNASGSYDNIGISNYTWLFENYLAAIKLYKFGKMVNFTFDYSDPYLVTLNVTDLSGNWATDNLTVFVIEGFTPIVELIYPMNQATLLGPEVTLSWRVIDYNAESFDLYFGNLSEPPLFRTKIDFTELDIQILDENEVFYWQIQARGNGTIGPISPIWSFKVEHGIPEFDLNISTKYHGWQIMQGSSGKFFVSVENEGSHSDWILINNKISDLPDSIFFEISENEFNLNPNQSNDIFFDIQTNNTTPVGHYFLTITAMSKGSLEYGMAIERSIQINLTITNTPSKDQDGDDLLDSWEIDWFDNIEKYDGEDDPDGDGKTNLEEYEDDTNPLIANVKTEDEESLIIIVIISFIIIITIFLILIIKNRGKGRDGEYNYLENYKL